MGTEASEKQRKDGRHAIAYVENMISAGERDLSHEDISAFLDLIHFAEKGLTADGDQPPAKGERLERVRVPDGREGRIDASWARVITTNDRECSIGFDIGDDGYARHSEVHLLSTLRAVPAT